LRRDNPTHVEGEIHLYIKGFGRFLRAEVIRCQGAEVAVRFVVDNDVVMGLLKGLSNYANGFDTAHTKELKEVPRRHLHRGVCRMADGTAVPCEIIDASMRSMSLCAFPNARASARWLRLGRTKGSRDPPSQPGGSRYSAFPLPA